MKEKVYFSTKLKKLLKNVGRTVWNESCTDKIYDYKGNVIGARKLFCFKVKQESWTMKSNKIMHEFSLVGKQEQTFWILCTLQKKESKSRASIKRRFRDLHSCVVTDVLLHEDETQQRKRMCCDVERNVPQGGNFILYPQKIQKLFIYTQELSMLINLPHSLV